MPLLATAAAETKAMQIGIRPESVTRGFGGRLYVTVMNDPKTPGDGVVKMLDGDQAREFASGMDEPKGICFTGKFLITTDVKKLWRIDAKGKKTLLTKESAFPKTVSFLNDVACEAGGKSVLVTDMGANTKTRDANGKLWPLDGAEAKALPALGRVYRVGLDGKVTMVLDTSNDMKCPNGVSSPGKGRVLVGEFFTGNLLEANAGKMSILATGYRGVDAIEEDKQGNLYVSSVTQGKVWRLEGKERKETVLLEGLQSAADFFLDEKGKQLIVPDLKAGNLLFLPLK